MIKYLILKILNKTTAKMRGSVGWYLMTYRFNRTYEGWYPLKAWWGAFLFKYRLLSGRSV